MNTEHRERCPQVSEVPAKYQLEFAAYLQSRRSGWMSAEQWLTHRMAGSGQAVRLQSPGTTRTEGTGRPARHEPNPQPPASTPLTVTDLGHRFVGAGKYPRHGQPMSDELLHEGTGEPITKATTRREDF